MSRTIGNILLSAATVLGLGHASIEVPDMPDEPCQSGEQPPATRPQRAKSSHKQNARKASKRRK